MMNRVNTMFHYILQSLLYLFLLLQVMKDIFLGFIHCS